MSQDIREVIRENWKIIEWRERKFQTVEVQAQSSSGKVYHEIVSRNYLDKLCCEYHHHRWPKFLDAQKEG